VGVLLIFYATPMSVVAKVVTTRSSASLYWPLAVMACVNGSLWVAYGLVSE
jgi:solute carrier family 50 protein (sugar transporter)